MLTGRSVVGWFKGEHGRVRRQPPAQVVNVGHWEQSADELFPNG